MSPQSGMVALKSFQSFMVNDGLLAKVVEAVKAGEREARSTGDIQTFEVFYKGFRQNIAIGRVMIVPAKVADSRENFPITLLYGCLVREFGGEEMADLLNYKIGDTEFDEYSKADLAAIKDKIFKNKEGKFESVIMFAPTWFNKREYVTFKFTKDDEKLTNLVRHLIFSAYFDPALSSAFNALMTDVSTDKLDVTNVTPKLNFPGIAENPLKDYPDMQKMGAGRKKIFLTKKTADTIEQSVLEPEELNVFEELNKVVERGLGVEPMGEVGKHEAAFSGNQDGKCRRCGKPTQYNFCSKECAKANNEEMSKGNFASPEEMASKRACGVLPVVEGVNVGPGTAAQDQTPPKPAEDLKGPEGSAPIGIELESDGTPAREESGKKAAEENPGIKGAYCPKCRKTTRHAIKGDEKQCMDCHTIGANIQQRAQRSSDNKTSAGDRRMATCPKCGLTFTDYPTGGGIVTCPDCRESFKMLASKKTAASAAGVAPAMDKQETVLYNQQGGSDKEYRVMMTPTGDGKWMVEAYHGRRGKATNKAQSFGPLDQAQAKVKYDELVAAKTSGGYTRSLEEQPKAPGSDALQALPARGQGSVIQFENATQVALYKGQLIGQMSDGAWENSGPRDHWRPMAEADVRVGKPGMNFSPRRTYGFANLIQYVGDEMLALARATKAYPNVDWSDRLAHAVSYISETPVDRLKEDWQKKYADAVLEATGETDISQVAARINGQPYGMGELRKDLRGIQNVVNGQWHKDNDARFASIKKEGRDRDEEMRYSGHEFRLTTWEERHNFGIELVDECCDRSIFHLVDDDARSAVEGGFIDPRHMIQSAIDYAESMNILWDGDDDSDLVASSEASRMAAKKHEADLAKKYAGRKVAEEQVPTADNILDEVLSDIGQAPLVNVPGDGQAATTPAAQNVPAPMKSEEPEQAKEQSAPEQEAKPFETTATDKTAGIRDAKKVLLHHGFQGDFGQATRSRGWEFMGNGMHVLISNGQGGVARSSWGPSGTWLILKGFDIEQRGKDPRELDRILSERLGRDPLYGPEAPIAPVSSQKKKASVKIADIMDLLEGTRHFGVGSRYGASVAEDIAQAKGEVDFDKAEMADNTDVDKTVSPEHFAAYTEEGVLPEETSEGAEAHYFKEPHPEVGGPLYECMDCRHVGPPNRLGHCEKCDSAAISKRIDTGAEAPSAKLVEGSVKEAGAEHKDDVPVSQGCTESGDQPVSDLSGTAPEAHDAPAQVDKKTAMPNVDPTDAQLYGGSDPEDNDAASYRQRAEEAIENEDDVIYDVAANSGQMVGNVKHMDWFVEAVAQALMEQDELENIDPLANAPGYREHSR